MGAVQSALVVGACSREIFIFATCSLQFAKAGIAATLPQQEKNNTAYLQRGRVTVDCRDPCFFLSFVFFLFAFVVFFTFAFFYAPRGGNLAGLEHFNKKNQERAPKPRAIVPRLSAPASRRT